MSLHPKEGGSAGASGREVSPDAARGSSGAVPEVSPLLEALSSAFTLARAPGAMLRAQRQVREFMTFLDQALAVLEPPGRMNAGLATSGKRGATVRPSIDAATPGGYVDGRVRTGFSEREREIVTMISQGLGVGHIARVLDISPHTVRNHLKTCYRKLGVHTQIELVNHVLAQGLVTKP